MKRVAKLCAPYEQSLALLAAGALPEPQRAKVEEHAAACAGCEQYLAALERITAGLGNWEKYFADVKPTAAAELRWANAIRAAARQEPGISTRLRLSDWWRELVWSCRHAWAGLAAVWIVLWMINSMTSTSRPRAVASGVVPTPAVIQALEEERQLLAELIAPETITRRSEPVDRNHAKPRSERDPVWRMI